MSWVEELKPDDEVTIEIRFPQEYIDYNIQGMRRYAAGISYLCKGAAILGECEAEFIVYDMTIMQIYSTVDVLKKFGVELVYENGKTPQGRRWTHFIADIRGLKERMENGEIDGDEFV